MYIYHYRLVLEVVDIKENLEIAVSSTLNNIPIISLYPVVDTGLPTLVKLVHKTWYTDSDFSVN